jgi:hypothetical protein
LRANLELAFPGAIGLFTKPASEISLAFLRRFPTEVPHGSRTGDPIGFSWKGTGSSAGETEKVHS